MCPGIFVQDPEKYLKDLHLSFACPVRNGRAAVLDSTYRAVVNHDLYYFSDRASLARFRRDPLRYCGRLTDPVTRARFLPTRSSPLITYRGRRYYFAADSTRAQFAATPDSFAVRHGG